LRFGEENALITLLEGAEQLDERPNLILSIRLFLLIAMSIDSNVGDHHMSTYTSAASLTSELKTRIDTRQARIGVIGLGYVGLPLALLYTEENFRVTGFDIDQHKVATLSSGGSYIYRIPPTEIQMARLRDFCVTADFSNLADMDAIIICVPTPLDEYREPDLSFVTNTGKAIAPHLRAGQLVVLESTTYPGTTEEVLVPILERGNGCGLKAAREETANGANEFFIAFSPEREDP
jgi:UDP-N-acetyl-D-glucosamine dehydrogenase